MDVSKAQLTNTGVAVTLVDPTFPWTVDVYLAEGTKHPEIRGLTIWARQNEDERSEPITAAVLAQLPIRQIASVAASALLGEGEALYRMLATPRPSGARSWPDDHFQRVVRVASWARRIGRPGGAGGAVAEFWAVDYRTARRWLSRARELGLA